MNRRNFIKATLATLAMAALPKISKTQNVKGKKMKILVLTGSPRKNGNSNTLADNFIKGAKESGHQVERFDAAFAEVHPCIGCNKCGMNGPCIFKDDFEFVRQNIVDELKIKVENYISYYNNERCQWSLNKMTPAQCRCHLLNSPS